MAGDGNGFIRELIRNDIEIHPVGFDAPVFHIYHGTVLGKIPSPAEGKLLTGVGHLAAPQWYKHRMRVQCQMGWLLLHGLGWLIHY